jgi:hypothetical protein
MAAKSILNELYQRLRTAAPVYKTQADEHSEGFVCFLTLPSVESEWEALLADRTFQGSGSSKKVRGWLRCSMPARATAVRLLL